MPLQSVASHGASSVILVLCGNHREFKIFCHKHKVHPNDPKVVYVADRTAFYGLRHFTLVRFRTWYARKDLKEINEELQIRKLVGKVVEE